MKRLMILLLIIIALVFGPLKQASAFKLHQSGSDFSMPMPGSVMAVAGSISGAGLAGRILLSRRQK